MPPPADALPECLRAFERFLNDEPEPTPPLLKAALAHVQFETIHPFLDGNGRVGRLLIVLQLVADGVLREPMLYLSLYFKRHRALYYELLNEVRLRGDWERWLEFFAEGIEVSATQAVRRRTHCWRCVNADRDRIAGLGRAAASALAVHQALQRQPIATSAALVKATGLTAATVNKSLAHLERIGVVGELTNRQRGRVFSYRRYVKELAAETEPTHEQLRLPPARVAGGLRGGRAGGGAPSTPTRARRASTRAARWSWRWPGSTSTTRRSSCRTRTTSAR